MWQHTKSVPRRDISQFVCQFSPRPQEESTDERKFAYPNKHAVTTDTSFAHSINVRPFRIWKLSNSPVYQSHLHHLAPSFSLSISLSSILLILQQIKHFHLTMNCKQKTPTKTKCLAKSDERNLKHHYDSCRQQKSLWHDVHFCGLPEDLCICTTPTTPLYFIILYNVQSHISCITFTFIEQHEKCQSKQFIMYGCSHHVT